jgi:folate-binding protein YgfZ
VNAIAQAQLPALQAPLAEGFLETKKIGLLQINGRDAKRFLQSQTTNNLDLLGEFSSQLSALTDRKAHLKGLFVLYRTRPESAYSLLVDTNCLTDIKEHLEKFLFADKVEIEAKEKANFLLLGPRSLALLARLAYPQEFNADNQLARPVESDCWSALLRQEISELVFDLATLRTLLPAQAALGELFNNSRPEALKIPASIYRLPAPQFTLLLSIDKKDGPLLQEALRQLAQALDFPHLIQEEEEYLAQRLLSNWPCWGKDIDEDNLLVELGLEHPSISYNKGCYQGQEVVARIKTFGAPARQIVGLSFELPEVELPKLKAQIRAGKRIVLQSQSDKIGSEVPNQELGFITSLYAYADKLQTNKKVLALATLKRNYVNPQVPLEAQVVLDRDNQVQLTASVQLLPFLPEATLKAEAKRLYDQALYCFSTNQEKRAITLLETALLMAPDWEEVYEALGVILSKAERLEDAIALMQKLAGLNPDSVMAHANLSVFYLEQGDKEKAEIEKAESMVIRMRLAAKEAMKEQKSKEALKEEEEKLRTETAERMKMFQEVLAIDANDLFANHGLGACHNLLKEYSLALPYLEKALLLKPNHAQAHLELGIALEGLGEKEKALEAYKKGIEEAAHRSDKSLLLALQAKLDNLTK